LTMTRSAKGFTFIVSSVELYCWVFTDRIYEKNGLRVKNIGALFF
jgi:hypothetical protein